jgi:hypothetical protein
MRYVVAIIGFLLWFLLVGQTVRVRSRGELTEDEFPAQDGDMGLFVAIICLVAAVLVFAFPRVSTGLFFAAGVNAWLAAGTTSHYPDLWGWGAVAFVLTGFAYIASRQKRARDAWERKLDDKKMALMAKAQATMAGVMTAPLTAAPLSMQAAPMPIVGSQTSCSACGATMAAGQRLCPWNCGGYLLEVSNESTSPQSSTKAPYQEESG